MITLLDSRTEPSLMVAALFGVAAFSIGMAFGLMPSKAETAPLSVPVVVHPPLPGRALFVQNCAHCHGDDATGSGEDGDGPDLHGLRISNARIATIVHHGIQGEMPSFSKKLAPADTAALIEYLRSLH